MSHSINQHRGGGSTRNAPASITVTPVFVADLHVEGERMPIYVHVIDVGSDRSVNRFYHQVAEVERLMIASFERESDWKASPERGVA